MHASNGEGKSVAMPCVWREGVGFMDAVNSYCVQAVLVPAITSDGTDTRDGQYSKEIHTLPPSQQQQRRRPRGSSANQPDVSSGSAACIYFRYSYFSACTKRRNCVIKMNKTTAYVCTQFHKRVRDSI